MNRATVVGFEQTKASWPHPVQSRLSSKLPIEPSTEPLATSSLTGAILGGRYRVKSLLGEGGMGRVYLAEDTLAEHPFPIVVKVLLDKYANNKDVAKYFSREPEIISAINHPNIVRVMGSGLTEEGVPYFVMEHLDGISLDHKLANNNTLPIQEAMHIAMQICDAIHAAHIKGIIHRDLKPENIFLLDIPYLNFVKIIDFGIARIMKRRTVFTPKILREDKAQGTPAYMAPEQAQGYIDRRTDIYGLGVMLYEMLCGATPFLVNESNPAAVIELINMHLSSTPIAPHERNPEIPIDISDLIMRALAKKPEDRYSSAAEMKAALEACLNPLEVPAVETAPMAEPAQEQLQLDILSKAVAFARQCISAIF